MQDGKVVCDNLHTFLKSKYHTSLISAHDKQLSQIEEWQ